MGFWRLASGVWRLASGIWRLAVLDFYFTGAALLEFQQMKWIFVSERNIQIPSMKW